MHEQAQRLIVGLVLLAFLIPMIIWLPSAVIIGIFALLCVRAVYEWGKLILNKDGQSKQRFLYIVLCVLSTTALAIFFIYYNSMIILYAAALWWFAALIVSTFYNTSLCSNTAFRYFLAIHIIIALAACIVAVYLLHEIAWFWLLYAVALVAICDASAYYVGRRIGKSKLAPTISSGKTKEGLWAALFASLILSLLAAAMILEDITILSVLSLTLLSLIACIAGVIGDLTESMAKRCADVKDSGKLLPGHGGLLDRIDAFIAAAPVIALGIFSLT